MSALSPALVTAEKWASFWRCHKRRAGDCLAQYFLSSTDQICVADGSMNADDLQSGWSLLAGEYGYMVDDAKDAFVDNGSSNATIASAKARYIYIVEKYDFDNYVTGGSGFKMIPSNVVSYFGAMIN
jgi:hypothetical protein